MIYPVIKTFRELPVLEASRRRTDVCCCILPLLFFIGMLVAACFSLNMKHLNRISFPTDADGRTCGLDLPEHPYVYLTRPTGHNLKDRLCVSSCPSQGDSSLNCMPTKALSCNNSHIMIYNSSGQVNRLGGYCIPSDKHLHSVALQNYNLHDKINFLSSVDAIKISLLVAFLLGVVYFLMAQWLSHIISWLIVAMAALSCLILAALLYTDKSVSLAHASNFKTIFSVILVFIACALLINLFWNRYSLKVSWVFLEFSTRMVRQNWFLIKWLLLFFLLSILLVGITLFQYLAFSSRPAPILQSNDIYWNAPTMSLGTILCFLQLIWGLSFLRDTFNYIVSGYGVAWYFRHSYLDVESVALRLWRYNFGSVFAGSFLNALFAIPDVFISMIRCGHVTFCASAAACCQICPCFNLFQLARTDAYSYIHLTGVPYCNAARQCEYLCNRSRLSMSSQSINKLYRISAHIFVILTSLICFYFISRNKLAGDISIKAMLIVLIGSMFICSNFLCLHADIADALMITYLAEEHLEELDPGYQQRAPRGLRRDLETMVRTRPSSTINVC